MSEQFINAMGRKFNEHKTQNGADSYKSTNSDLLDLFGTIGGMRSKLDKVENDFVKAFHEDNLLATKLAFHTRNIRGGLGERDIFKRVLTTLVRISPKTLEKNLHLISQFGRWDDLFVLIGTSLEDKVISLLRKQLNEDANAEYPSLLAKWMPSANASSKKTKKLAKHIIKKFGITEKTYRVNIVKLRDKINIVETKMSKKNWKDIEYGKVPSKAMNVYRNAFKRHDESGFEKFIGNVVDGTEKINASTLYPYDIIEKMDVGIQYGWSSTNGLKVRNYDQVLEEQWKALPNYVEGDQNIMVMADTSGSMSGRPLITSLGLAIYFAQRNHGTFHNTFMTFSREPKFVQFKDGMSVYDILSGVSSINSNTNMERAFLEILSVAKQNRLEQSDMPKALVVISDLAFDSQMTGNCYGDKAYNSLFEKLERQYREHGYEMPNVIFWNVNDTNSGFQVSCSKRGVQLASGQSPSVFKSIVDNIGKSPYEAMANVLNDEMYSCITI